MSNKQLDQLITQMEHYLECWKQFNHYIAVARSKNFSPEDEAQFLDVKSVITQEMELIFASIDSTNPSKEEVLGLIANAPSIRYMSELNEQALKGMENTWHKIYIGWQSLLGQLKVQQKAMEKKSFWGSLFGK